MPVSAAPFPSQVLCDPFHTSPTVISSAPVSSPLHVTHEIQAPPLTDIGVHVPTKAKQSRSLAFPSPDDRPLKRAKTTVPVGMSKTAAWKRKTLDKIEDGTWVLDTGKWETYKSKLENLDRHFEAYPEPRLVRYVKHSSCGSWVLMSVPYDIGRFKSHVKSCSYSTAPGGMRTLDSYGVCVRPMNSRSPSLSIPSASSSPLRTDLPCPGITEKDDIRIAQYMKRTPMNTAGGSNIQGIAKELFSDQYKDLSKKAKDIVRQKQEQTCSWSNDHIRKSIHAIGKNPCDSKARLAKDGSLMPCNQCLALLTLRSFRNAISKPCVENENRVFMPHVYQSPDVGIIWNLGIFDLLDGVRTTSLLTQCSTHNLSRTASHLHNPCLPLSYSIPDRFSFRLHNLPMERSRVF